MPPSYSADELRLLADKAARLRIDSVRATTAAGSGHPTSCASAAEIVSVLFFSEMRFDPQDPGNPRADKFVLSKGHAAPILYAAWAEAGAFPVDELVKLRHLGSDLEGHPTPRLPFVDVATGSLGQGLSAGLGLALGARLQQMDQRIYVLLGDGESAEGSVWEAAEMGPVWKLGNVCVTVDVNRLGQSRPTLLQHDMNTLRRRWEAFGWHALVVDGHSIPELLEAYRSAREVQDRPTVVLAQTLKGKGLLEWENSEGKHGQPMKKEDAERVIAALEQRLEPGAPAWKPKLPPAAGEPRLAAAGTAPPPPYTPGQKDLATRRAFGDALAAIGKTDPRIVALDGDVSNSTYTEDFAHAFPERFFECYIAEQNMVGAAMGLSAHRTVPFAATFGCFLTRAADFVRMAAIGGNNVKFAGTHVGVSIGEDGPSQMGLEDIAIFAAEPDFTVLYPSDATSAWRAVELVAAHQGPCYLRLGRPASSVIYDANERFSIGKCKVLRSSERDQVLVIAGGVTLFEALKAADELKQDGVGVRVVDLFSIQPIDREALVMHSRAVGGLVVTVEDHYAHGGLGDAVLAALAGERIKLHKMAVREIPHSGKPPELLERYGLSARHIVEAVRKAISSAITPQ
jgi:transketolase